MIAADENALTCDFAETYHIYDWRRLPARYAATLAAGLSVDSRIIRKLTGIPGQLEHMLLAVIADACMRSVWQRSQAAAEGKPPPESLYASLFGRRDTVRQGGFADGAEFDVWREKMIGGEKNAE